MIRISGKELERARQKGLDVRLVTFRKTNDVSFQTGCPHCIKNLRIAKELGAEVLYDEENFDVLGVDMSSVSKSKLKKVI